MAYNHCKICGVDIGCMESVCDCCKPSGYWCSTTRILIYHGRVQDAYSVASLEEAFVNCTFGSIEPKVAFINPRTFMEIIREVQHPQNILGLTFVFIPNMEERKVQLFYDNALVSKLIETAVDHQKECHNRNIKEIYNVYQIT